MHRTLVRVSVLLAGGWCFVAIAAPATNRFTDVTDASGVGAIVSQHYETVSNWWLSGMTLLDMDGDGDLDLHLAGHGMLGVAAANDGKGHFTKVDPKPQIPRGKNKKEDLPYPGGEVRLAYDLNEDGKLDILCSWGDGGGVVYQNTGTAAAWNFKVIDPGFDAFSRATAMADMNGDGLADYLVTADGKRDWLRIVFGKGGGLWGGEVMVPVLPESGGVPVDIDGDGDLDLLGCMRGYHPVGRQILLNTGNLAFSNVTVDAGLTTNGGSIHGYGDVNQDGAPDLICVEGRQIVVYLNDGKGRFKAGPAVEGLAGTRGKPSTGNWGGAVVTDIDNDGIADVLVNGKAFLYVLRGTGGGKLECVNEAWGIPSSISPAVEEGLCFGDIDADGDLDIVTCGKAPAGRERGVCVLRNDLPQRHWLRVRLAGRAGNMAAAAAKIRIYEAGGLNNPSKLLRYEQVGIWGRQCFHSYYAASRTERHFGLGDRQAVDVSVEFHPSHRTAERKGVKADEAVDFAEP